MTELLRNLAGRLREVVANRRASPRRPARLPCLVSFPDPRASDHGRRPPTLQARTRDLSATGVAIIAPVIRINDRYLTDSTLLLRLELPAGTIEMIVKSVRYERLAPEDEEEGYLVGVHILEMKEENRARYDAHLRGLE
ncbi:MAG: PilZ domain-containing protein [Acidobacteria bacterium]|nr:PilZ domain-containing protein [Acidobacteriota bacterium]MCA1642639.1 PilZ domain-containing protein [Acidobacteriota bacterium]